MNYLLTLIIFSPVLGMIVLAFINKKSESALKWTGTLATLPPLVLTLLLLGKTLIEKQVSSFSEKWKWIQFGDARSSSEDMYAIYYELGIDGLSLAMLVLTAIIAFFAALTSWRIKSEWKGYFLLFLLLEIGMLGLFAAENFFLFFLFFEMTLVATFFLIGKWGFFDKEKAAFQFLIYNGLGSAILLLVIGALFARTGTVNFEALEFALNTGGTVTEISEAAKWGLFIALLLALGIKLPIVPFHKWMVHVHKEAHPAIVMIHSGILLKIGAYGLIRFGVGIFPEQWQEASTFIIVLGVINILYGAFLALIQEDLKLVWAYSSISHMGFVLVGLGALNEAGVQGAIFQAVSHGFISALLFLLVCILTERYQTTTLQHLGGVAKTMPIFSGLLLIGGMASLGLPATSGFVSEFTVLIAVFENNAVLGSLAAFGLILTAAYILRAVLQITFSGLGKRVKIKHQPSQEQNLLRNKSYSLKIFEWGPAFLLVGLIIGLGLFPQILVEVISETVMKTMMGIGG